MRKKMDNKGFSLVELIIVIAIMAVLVGVLAPQFMKYVEQSRKATDIQNAEMIRDAILADIADGTLKGTVTGAEFVDYTTSPAANTVCASAVVKAPVCQGTITLAGNIVTAGTTKFTVDYNATEGTCSVKLNTYTLTDSTQANNYKLGKSPSGT